MRLLRLAFKNHPILGNLELDFTDKEGKPVNTIIIAGENGVGKSQLLNIIFELSNGALSNIKRNEKRIFQIQLSDKEVNILKQNDQTKHYFDKDYEDNILQITIDYNIISDWRQVDIRGKIKNGFSESFIGTVFIHNDTRSILRTIFSDVEINFTSNDISTVTSRNIDTENLHRERSSSNLATEITQLLIDVQSLDALEFTEWARTNPGQLIDDDKIDVRLRRFTTAFDYMFPTKKYKRIINSNNSKHIVFEENGKEMSINNLSSGEKQIVFRGSFLLKDKESSKGALILIDEPEISLHPTWQLKVLGFFKKLFTNQEGEQTSQIIISTHSPFILHNANRMDDKVIVLQKSNQGQIRVLDEPKFFTWSNEKVVQEAFSITHVLDDNKTTVFVEGETDEKYYNKCQEIFGKQEAPLLFRWIGRINDKGQAENTGDTALNQAKTFFTANMDHAKNKIVLLYDSDTNKPEEDNGNLLVRIMHKNNENQIFTIGVENLLTLIDDINPANFYTERVKINNYGAKSILSDLDKMKLCSFICETLEKEKQKVVLQNLNFEIDRLLNSL
jgi:predicted ATPase